MPGWDNHNHLDGKRGFQLIDPERQRQIASQGGLAAHASGKAHQWTSDEARAAGQKGQANRKAKKEAARVAKEAQLQATNLSYQREGSSSWPGTVDSSDGSAT